MIELLNIILINIIDCDGFSIYFLPLLLPYLLTGVHAIQWRCRRVPGPTST